MEENSVPEIGTDSQGNVQMQNTNQSSLNSVFGGSIGGAIISSIVGLIMQSREFNQQEKMLQAEQQFSSMEAEKSRNFNSESAKYQRLLDLGINPMIAAASVSGSGTQQPSQTAFSPSAPNVPQISGSIANMLGSSVNNAFQNLRQMAEIEKIGVENKYIDSQRFLNQMHLNELPQNYAIQRSLWNSQADYYINKMSLDSAEKDYFKSKKAILDEQLPFVASMSDAQINLYKSQIRENNTKVSLLLQQFRSEIENTRKLHAEANQEEDKEITVKIDKLQAQMKQQISQILGGIPYSSDFIEMATNAYIKYGENAGSKIMEMPLDFQVEVKRRSKEMEFNFEGQHYWKQMGRDLGNGVIQIIPSAAKGFGQGFGASVGLKSGGMFFKPSPIGFNR